MDEKWSINRQAVPIRILEKIAGEMRRPLGLLFFGVDTAFKTAQVDRIRGYEKFGPMAYGLYGMTTDAKMRHLVSEGETISMWFDSEQSADRDLRLTATTRLYMAGVATVVGFYIKSLSPSPLDAKLSREFALIEQNPPGEDEVDYLIIIPQASLC